MNFEKNNDSFVNTSIQGEDYKIYIQLGEEIFDTVEFRMETNKSI